MSGIVLGGGVLSTEYQWHKVHYIAVSNKVWLPLFYYNFFSVSALPFLPAPSSVSLFLPPPPFFYFSATSTAAVSSFLSARSAKSLAAPPSLGPSSLAFPLLVGHVARLPEGFGGAGRAGRRVITRGCCCGGGCALGGRPR